MTSETKPCPFYGMPCEYVPMAEKSDAQADEIERLRAALREIADCKTFTDRKYMIDIARAALESK